MAIGLKRFLTLAVVAFCYGLVSTANVAQSANAAQSTEIVIVGGEGVDCLADPDCVNRLHPDIPMTARAAPGQTILFRTRDAVDVLGVASAQGDTPPEAEGLDVNPNRAHALTGPVFIEGAEAGDVLAVTLNHIEPGRYAWTSAGGLGFALDLIPGPRLVIWELTPDYAETDGIPGIRIPNGSFPGVVTTLPGHAELDRMLAREQALLDAGGSVFGPSSEDADPPALCGPAGTERNRCLRTIPPREHGGNMDIRYLQSGVTVYLPC